MLYMSGIGVDHFRFCVVVTVLDVGSVFPACLGGDCAEASFLLQALPSRWTLSALEISSKKTKNLLFKKSEH